MFENQLGEFIREKRIELGFSVREIAEKAEISFSQWSKLERGKVKDPSDETLNKVAYALNVDKDRIYTLAGRIPPDLGDITQLVAVSEEDNFYEHLTRLIDRSMVVSEESNTYLAHSSLLEQFAEVAATSDETKELSADEILFIAKELESAFKLSVKRLKSRKSNN
ncbi:helix-turn-helix domain-containing protein [Paenibacillus sp. p3-SID1389]|uniref:helix-turn-helix domain-containing protein n=1 Tax=Paenibacillus sp. p3-SID1389 TaxID=2916364 RepID=UPI0021A32520|nr:helix-turn-helix transcriptional regulator [Paenibacillus sp. p3-SID1389]MCT2195199.1 helix-turn-helix domain-containing protein [Paenibacillus sp. p3-SID1389]